MNLDALLPVVQGVSFARVSGLDGYAVGDDGSVWSCNTRNGTRVGWNRLSVHRRDYGSRYCVVSLREQGGKGKVVVRYVHRLVLLAFVGPPPAGCIACHNDGQTDNNTLANLRWDSHRGNAADKERHGTKKVKLDNVAVRKVYRLWDDGWTARELAKRFKVNPTTIRNVVAGRTHADVFAAIRASEEE